MGLTEEEADKLRYGVDSSGNVNYTGSVGITAFKKPETMEEDLSFYGFSSSEIENIMNKINTISESSSTVEPFTSINPSTGQSSTNPNGSLVSNSAKAFTANTDYQKARIETEKLKITAMNESNRIAQAQLIASIDSNTTAEATLILLSERYLQTDKLIEAIKNQKLTTGSINVNPSVNIDTTALATATQALASGVEDQKATNAKIVENLTKKNDHLDYLKDGHTELKDTNGNAIKPREVEAKINAEKLIEQTDTNKTTFDEIADFVDEALGVVEDTVEKALDTTAGFDLNFNPLQYVDDLLMSEFQKTKDVYENKHTPQKMD